MIHSRTINIDKTNWSGQIDLNNLNIQADYLIGVDIILSNNGTISKGYTMWWFSKNSQILRIDSPVPSNSIGIMIKFTSTQLDRDNKISQIIGE